MMRGKIICRHFPNFCWKTRFVELYPETQIFVYPVRGSIGNYPTLYKVILILQVPTESYKEEFHRAIEECIDSVLVTKGEFEKLQLLNVKDGKGHALVLSLYRIELIHEDKENSKASSLLYALYDQQIPPDEPEKATWVHVECIAETASETMFPRYSSSSVFKESIENIKAIKFNNNAAFEVRFPCEDAEYEKDYVKEYIEYHEPMEYLLPSKTRKKVLMDIENKVIRKNGVMQKIQECGTKLKPVIEIIRHFH